jgi:hypothetical protein
MMNPGAAVPPNVTALDPVKEAPLMVTLAPTGPLGGLKLDTVGPTAKLVELSAVPVPVVTLIGPVVAPDGTIAVIWVSELTM